ncbi:hypothetical protein BJ878DRAFT_504712 [Calycina marina]|uniref:DUF1304-domain-containing protein n=1 Tax=Calycina marina TaxID=1763456 RepID=A0A9P7Z3Q4_9HELO|nr:hypothetical protein BJ878DRAFT_504712 [Calycina marina]
MSLLSTIPVAAVTAIHGSILVLEMFLWNTPRGHKVFRMKPQYAASTAVLAANQGLYNGFLAAGLAWGLAHPNAEFAMQIKLFFLGCVFVAGAYGGATVNKKILGVQVLPAAVAVVGVLVG